MTSSTPIDAGGLGGRTRLLTVLFVGVLVALAGCSGGGTTAGDGGSTTTPGEGAIEPLPSDQELLNAHTQVLNESESFSVRNRFSGTIGGEGRTNVRTTRVDLAAGTYYANWTFPDGSQERYVSGPESGFLRQGKSVREVTPSKQASDYVAPLKLRQVLTNASALGFEPVGRTTVNGTEVTHYVANDTEAAREVFSGDSEITIESIEIHIYRRDDGLVKRLRTNITTSIRDRTAVVNTTITFYNVGETIVSPPEWVQGYRSRDS